LILSSPRTHTAAEVLEELEGGGYTLDVRTRVELSEANGGAHSITYADKLLIKGPSALTPELREVVAEYRDELLAAACVMDPPVSWLRVLVDRYYSGYAVEVRRIGWKGPYQVRLAMIAANVAAFIGLHPAHDGPRLEAIIEEALR
jgi:hypothetical protein